jgi:hypothetical protein
MPEFTVDFEVYCSKCGAGLCNQSTTEVRRGYPRVTVEPCTKCLDDAKNEGYDEGYKTGIAEGDKE